MGGAAAEVLTDIFGNYFPMTDRCHEGREDFEGGKPRQFNSFYEMANENAISRVPLGVHFRMDCEQGVNLGIRVGRKVNQFSWKKGEIFSLPFYYFNLVTLPVIQNYFFFIKTNNEVRIC